MSKVCSSHNLACFDGLVNEFDAECIALEVFVKFLYELNPDDKDYERYSNALHELIFKEMEAFNLLYNRFNFFRDCLQQEKEFEEVFDYVSER